MLLHDAEHLSTTKHPTSFYARKLVEMQANLHHGWSWKKFNTEVSISSILIYPSVPQSSMFSFSSTSLCLAPSLITVISRERRIDNVNARCTRKGPTNSSMVFFLASKYSSIAKTSIILIEFLLLARFFVPAKCTAGVHDKTFFLLSTVVLRHTIIYECKSIFNIQLNPAISNSQGKRKIFRTSEISK